MTVQKSSLSNRHQTHDRAHRQNERMFSRIYFCVLQWPVMHYGDPEYISNSKGQGQERTGVYNGRDCWLVQKKD